MNQQNQVFRVTLTGALQASNPIEAAHLFSQHVGQPGFDKFQVTDSQGEQNVVDINLLVKMGILTIQQGQEAPADEVNVDSAEEKEQEVQAEVVAEEV